MLTETMTISERRSRTYHIYPSTTVHGEMPAEVIDRMNAAWEADASVEDALGPSFWYDADGYVYTHENGQRGERLRKWYIRKYAPVTGSKHHVEVWPPLLSNIVALEAEYWAAVQRCKDALARHEVLNTQARLLGEEVYVPLPEDERRSPDSATHEIYGSYRWDDTFGEFGWVRTVRYLHPDTPESQAALKENPRYDIQIARKHDRHDELGAQIADVTAEMGRLWRDWAIWRDLLESAIVRRLPSLKGRRAGLQLRVVLNERTYWYRIAETQRGRVWVILSWPDDNVETLDLNKPSSDTAEGSARLPR